jgi:hypothetical protein
MSPFPYHRTERVLVSETLCFLVMLYTIVRTLCILELQNLKTSVEIGPVLQIHKPTSVNLLPKTWRLSTKLPTVLAYYLCRYCISMPFHWDYCFHTLQQNLNRYMPCNSAEYVETVIWWDLFFEIAKHKQKRNWIVRSLELDSFIHNLDQCFKMFDIEIDIKWKASDNITIELKETSL